MCRRAFEKLVEKALERLPGEFRQAFDNLAIVIEDWPDPAIVEEITGDPSEVIYGLFSGTPLPERRFEDSSVDAGVYQKGKQLAQWVGDEETLASAAAALSSLMRETALF